MPPSPQARCGVGRRAWAGAPRPLPNLCPSRPKPRPTLHRFTYQLLQGYDFVHLAREHGVRVQARG